MIVGWLWDLALRPVEWVAGLVALIVGWLPDPPALPSVEAAADTVALPGRIITTGLWCLHLEWLPRAALLLGGAWLVWWLTWRIVGLIRGGGDAR